MPTTKTPMVSVIVPAIGAGSNLRRTLESVLNQSHRDLELVVAYDPEDEIVSPVVELVASRDWRLIPLEVEGTTTDALNAALDVARGTYVAFVGSNAWVAPGMYATLVDMADRANLELVVSGVYVDTPSDRDGGIESMLWACPEHFYPTQHDFRAAAWQLFDANQILPLGNKLYLRRHIEESNIRFSGASGEGSFALGYLADVERVAVTDRAFYHIVRSRSLTTDTVVFPDAHLAREREREALLALFHGWGLDGDPASMDMLQRRYLEHLIGSIETVCGPRCTLPTQEKRRLIEEMISTDQAKLAASVAKPRSGIARAMLGPIRSGNASLVYSEGRFMSFVRRHNPAMAEPFDLYL